MRIVTSIFSKMRKRIASLFYSATVVAAVVMLGNKVDFLLVTVTR